MKAKIVLELEYWQAVRLTSLLTDGFDILHYQNRTQRGIDGYTIGDLRQLADCIKTEDKPKYANGDLFN